MYNSTILIAEDDNDYIFLIDAALKEIAPDINWTFFVNGEDLLEFVRESETKPSLIITDLSMPKKNGFEVLKEIKENRILVDVPVVIFTNSSAPIDIELASQYNCDGYYIKGNDLEDYKDALKDMLTLIKVDEFVLQY